LITIRHALSQQIQSTLSTSHSALSTLLTSRSDLRSEKRLVELLIHLDESLARTEGLLGLGPNNEDNIVHLPARNDDEEEAAWDESDEEEDEVGPELYVLPPQEDVVDLTKEDEEVDAKLVARIANEYTQLTYLVDQARKEECAYVGGIEERMSAIRQSLHSKLSRLLQRTLERLQAVSKPVTTSGSRVAQIRDREEQRQALKECLNVYDAVEGWREAEEVVAVMIRGSIAKVVTLQALTVPPEPSVPSTPFPLNVKSPGGGPYSAVPATPVTPAMTKQTNVFEQTLAGVETIKEEEERPQGHLEELDNPLAALYNRLLKLVQTEYLDLLDVASSLKTQRSRAAVPDAPLTRTSENNRFEFLANVIWAEVADRIVAEIGSVVFAAGRVAELHKVVSRGRVACF